MQAIYDIISNLLFMTVAIAVLLCWIIKKLGNIERKLK